MSCFHFLFSENSYKLREENKNICHCPEILIFCDYPVKANRLSKIETSNGYKLLFPN